MLGIVQLITISLNALFDVLLSVAVGALVSFLNIATKKFKSELSKVALDVFLPCLLFSAMVTSLDLSKSKVILQKFFVCFFHGAIVEAVGFTLGYIVFQKRFVGLLLHKVSVFACMFGNTTTLPLMFITVICGTPGLFLLDSNLTKDQNRAQAILLGTTYISALFASFAFVFWTFGFSFYTLPDEHLKRIKEAEERAENPTPKVEEKKMEKFQNMIPVEEDTPGFDGQDEENQENYSLLRSNEKKIEKRNFIAENAKKIKAILAKIPNLPVLKQILAVLFFLKKWYYLLHINNIVNVPLISLMLGMITACIQPARHFLVVAPPPGVQAIMHVMKETGDIYAKCVFIVLGMSLYESFTKPKPKNEIGVPKNGQKFSVLQKTVFFFRKIHNYLFPYTNALIILMTIAIKQVCVPIVIMFFLLGYLNLAGYVQEYIADTFITEEDISILWKIIRLLFQIIPTNDPILLFTLFLIATTPTTTSAILVCNLKKFGEPEFAEILMYQYLLSPVLIVCFTAMSLYLSCFYTQKCY